ncbi:MAG: YcxB family protein [Pirellulales bacterium]
MAESAMSGNPFAAPEHGVPSAAAGAAPLAGGATTDGQGSYTVEFELQVEDLVDFQMHQWKTNRVLRRQRLLQRISAPSLVLIVGVLGALMVKGPTRGAWLGGFISFAGYVVFLTRDARLRKTIDRNMRRLCADGKNRNLFGWHRVTIDTAGYHETSQYSESFYRWPAIERVDSSPQHVLVYLSSAYSVLIPKLAFRDQAQLDAFVAAAQRYHREALQNLAH